MKKIIVTTCLLIPLCSFANDFKAALTDFATKDAQAIVSNSDIISAINEQNMKNSNLSDADILALDKQWRAQIGDANAKLISDKLNRPLSKELVKIQEESAGKITEIFIMDNKGLNVAQSAITSDYWQGDEAKWQQTYLIGPKAFHISEVEEDESTQMFQSQVSHAISDPATGKTIGAVTIGINVEEL